MMTGWRRVLTIAVISLVLCASIAVGVRVGHSRVTRENFFRLADGMTVTEAEEIFGEKGDFWQPEGSDFGLEYRCWVGGGVAYAAFDRRGGLRHKQWHEDGFPSPTRVNFDRLRGGMTQQEIRKVMGRDPNGGAMDKFGEGGEVWRDFDGGATVGYKAGRASEFHWFEYRDRTIEEERRFPLQRRVRRLFGLES